MMSTTQKALLYANIPTSADIYGVEVNKMYRDRFPMSPITYPMITVSILSEGIKAHWNTWAPVSKVWNETTQEYDNYYGEQDIANISLTVWSETEEELRQICDVLEITLKLTHLGFDWPTDHMKFTGVKAVQLLEPYADKFVQEHTWRAVIDFTVEYLWAIPDVGPAIRAYEYLFETGNMKIDDLESMDTIDSFMPGSYGMNVLLKGWRSTVDLDVLLLTSVSSSYSSTLKVISG